MLLPQNHTNSIVPALSGQTSRPQPRLDMNKEFLIYLQNCPEPQLMIWTWLFAQSNEQDIITVNLLDLRLRFKHTPKIFTKVLALDDMQGKQFIVYELIDKSTVKIKFNRKIQQSEKQIETSDVGNDNELKTSKNKKESKRKQQKAESQEITIQDGNDKTLSLKVPEVMPELPVRKIEWDTELKDMLIDDYIDFFKSVQAQRAFDAGIMNPVILPPKIDGSDIKHFKLLAAYFRSLPRKSGTSQPLTNAEVRMCLQKIYTSWEMFTQFIQNGIKPQQILYNINNIIIQLQPKTQTTKADQREKKFDEKINETGSRDYSHILQRRSTNN